MPPLVSEVFEVLEGPEFSGLWPEDGKEKKRKHIEFCFKSGLLTPLEDSKGSLAGFLIFYRGRFLDGILKARPDDGGPFVVCSVLWIRPDLRGGDTMRRLIRKAVIENRDKILGAEILAFERLKKPGYFKFNFPRFYRRAVYGVQKRVGNDTTTKCKSIDHGDGPEHYREHPAA